jgi:hypothetical protein
MEAGEFCFASRLVLEGRAIGLMYRERPFAPEDSGWRFFAGDEDGGFVADPRNVPYVGLAELVRLDPAITAWLDAPRGTALERNAAGELARVDDVDHSDDAAAPRPSGATPCD